MYLFTVLIITIVAASCARHQPHTTTATQPLAIVHGFENTLDGVHTRNPAVNLRIATDLGLGKEAVLVVEYPPPSGDPAARDVQLDIATANWSRGRALSFQVRPAAAIRLSLSFIDRNGVVYTSWTNLQRDVWQTVRIDFAAIRPNPFFQPPGATVSAALDVTEVKLLAFAP